MIEMMGDWIITAATYLSILLTGGCFAFLTKDYVKKPSYAVLSGMAYAATMIMLKMTPYMLNNVAAYGIGVMASTLVLCIADRRMATMKLFLATTFYSIRWLVAAIEVSIVTMPVGSFVGYINAKQNNEALAFAMFIAQVLLDLLVELGLMIAVIIVLNRCFKCKTYDMSWNESVMLCAPSICAVLGYCVKIMYRDIFYGQTGNSIDDYLGIYSPISYAYYICSILSILAVIILFQGFKLRQEETMSQTVLKMQMEDMRRTIAHVERGYDKVRALRHDMGNHIQILKGMFREGDRQEADAYMSRLEEAYQGVVPASKTGNPVTDIILDEKYAKASDRGIHMDMDFHFPTGTNADAFDMGIILSNALDNAISAVCPEDPFVSVYSKRRNDILLICVENSFAGKLVIDDDTGLPKTKKSGDGHGWGMANMKNCVGKYFGEINIEQKNGRVILCAMLSLKGKET